jgi:hypothetical protein
MVGRCFIQLKQYGYTPPIFFLVTLSKRSVEREKFAAALEMAGNSGRLIKKQMKKLELAKCAKNRAVLYAENRTFSEDTLKRRT